MDHEEMKLECLRLAVQAGLKGADAMKFADDMYAFCRGRGEAPGLQNSKVKVVGKNNDLGPFTDYVHDK